MSTVTVNGPDAARTLRELVAEESADSERHRTLNARTVEALWGSGLMQWANPTEAGGCEPSFAEMIDTWIELAWQDGSLGWIGIANLPSAAACAAYLPDEGFVEVFTEHGNRVTAGGQFFPNGLGETVDGGYRVTGAWNFGSGTGHAEYVAAGFMPTVGGEMILDDEGIPPLLVAVIPRQEIVFTDGWHVQGLKGTGSYDYNVTDLFVPDYRTFELFATHAAAGWLAGIPDGPDAHHGGRTRLLGARAWPRACSTTSPNWPGPRSGWVTRAPSPTSRRSSGTCPTTLPCGRRRGCWWSPPSPTPSGR